MRACRTSVREVIDEFRKNIQIPFICPITGDEIYNKHDIHVDHYDMTFEDLFYMWLENKDIDYLYSKIQKSSDDNIIEPFIDDKDINDDFLKFHNSHTHLRFVSKKANLSNLRK